MSQSSKNNNELSGNKISTFNSKLFLDIELSEGNISSNSDTEDSEISIKYPYIELKDYLSNDLIEELELPSYAKNNNINDKNIFLKDNKNDKKISLIKLDEKKDNVNNKNKYNNTNFNSIKNKFDFEINNNRNKNNSKNKNKFNSSTINILIPLLDKGYEFYPKNLKSSNFEACQKLYNENEKAKISNFIKRNEYLFNKNKKEDWYCSFCNNLNYSFRIKCNRCGSSKESSEYIHTKMIEQKIYNSYNIYNQSNNNYTNSPFNNKIKLNYL